MREQIQYLIPAALIVNSEGKVFFTKKSSARAEICVDRWEIPGGTVRFGEDPLEGLRRKIEEYIGAKVEVEKMIPHIYSYVTSGTLEEKEVDMQFLVLGFKCSLEDPEQEFHLQEGKIEDVKWFSQDEYLALPENDKAPGDLEIIQAAGIWEV